jgi:hypothetical protein
VTYPSQYPAQQNYPTYPQQQSPQQFPYPPQAPQQGPQAPQYPAANQQAPQQAATFQPVPNFVSAPGTSEFPKMADLRGRLLLIKPQKIENVASTQNPGTTFESVGCDVTVLDGGPIVSQDPKTRGKVFDGHEFKNIGMAGMRVTGQLRGLVGGTDLVLGRLDTQQGTGAPAKGNAWGIETDFTPADAELATRYLNGDRSFVVMPGASHFQAPAPQQFQQAVAQHHAQQYNQAPPAPAPAAPGTWMPGAAQQAPANPWDQGGQPIQPGANPFAQQG